MVNRGWLDGASFYQFIKKGGMLNLIEGFHWFGDKLHLIDENDTQLSVYLFDECCVNLKHIFTSLINCRNSDHNINSLLGLSFGSDFDNVKNLYQTFYHIVCTKLLPLDELNSESGKNLILKLHNVRCPYLLDIVVYTLELASK